MEYNIIENTSVYPDYDEGDIILTYNDIKDLKSNSANISIDAGNIFSIECDFGHRLLLKDIKYYFSGTLLVDDVDISFKNEPSDVYTSLSVIPQTDHFRADLFNHRPRYVKINHSPTTSGNANGIEILNNDSYINFGEDGFLSDFSMESSLNISSISTLPIYNNGPQKADAYVMLDINDTYIDNVLYIASSPNGPWINSKYINNIIMDGTHLNIFHNNTLIDRNAIVVDDTTISGTFTTGIFYNDDLFTSLLLEYVEEGTSMITFDKEKINRTAKIKVSDIKPKNNTFMRIFDSGTHTDYSIYDGLVINSFGGLPGGNYYSRTCMNPKTGTCYTLFTRDAAYNDSYVYLSKAMHNNSVSHSYIDGVDNYQSNIDLDVKYMLPDVEDGLWAYFYVNNYASPINDDIKLEPGYHLIHFNSNREITMDVVNQSDFIDDMSVCWYDNELWYASSFYGSVTKINTVGTILFTITDNIYDLKSIVAKNDGGCIYVNDDDLIFIDRFGILSEHRTKVANMRYIRFEPNNENILWLIEGYNVCRYIVDDMKINKKIYVSSVEEIYPTDSGVFCICSDEKARFYRKNEDDIIIIDRISNDIYPILFDLNYDNPGELSYMFPIEKDETWNNVEWVDIDYTTFHLPKDKYFQLKFNMICGEDISPEVIRIYSNKSVKVDNILPGTHKNLYLKIESGQGNKSGNYESAIIVKWGLYE